MSEEIKWEAQIGITGLPHTKMELFYIDEAVTNGTLIIDSIKLEYPYLKFTGREILNKK